MTAKDDIAFLEAFREKITAFFIAGTVPTQDPLWGGSALADFEKAMKDPAFRAMRQDINRMKGRAALILEGFSINCTFTQYPPPAVGGPVTKFPLFNLITDNQSVHTIDGAVFTDKIDEAIGLLEAGGSVEQERGALPVFEVRNLDTALEFYRETLDFAVQARQETAGLATLTYGGANLILSVSESPRPSRAVIRNASPPGIQGSAVSLGDQMYVEIADPDGNRLLFEATL
ncbi:MAG: hypothetical protein OXT06_05695 [Rhodospirillaceae bacterium]|nr:hypothetical protein [Rhodospirillaceae bacterium]MDD9924548.1 hypothetical protein [Rhodospirillaceae bacterium]